MGGDLQFHNSRVRGAGPCVPLPKVRLQNNPLRLPQNLPRAESGCCLVAASELQCLGCRDNMCNQVYCNVEVRDCWLPKLVPLTILRESCENAWLF